MCIGTSGGGRCKVCCACAVFFFKAEDCIRDYKVTGVQTCALPILTVLLLSSVESISPSNATTIRGTGMLTIEPLSGDVLLISKRCTAFTAVSIDIAAAALGAP